MSMKRRPGTRKGKTANRNQESAQMILALSSDQHASIEALISPDPPVDPAVGQARRQLASPSPGMAAPPEDPRAPVDPGEPAPVPPSQVGEPVIRESSCILSDPSALDQQDAAAPSPSRRFTLDSLLQLAKVVETLRGKALAERAIADENAGAGKRENGQAGNGGVQSAAPTPRIRSGTACPPTCPDGDPELPPAQWEREE